MPNNRVRPRRKLLHRYLVWHLLRRLRTRNNGSPVTRQQVLRIRAHRRATETFLDWLDTHNLTLDIVRQADLDRWLTDPAAGYRYETATFIRWAHEAKLTTAYLPSKRWQGPVNPLDDDHRWTAARRLPHDSTLDPGDRLAGLFLHTTFGEYLVARFTWHILNDLHMSESSRHHRVSGAQPDDSHLHAQLSLTPLTSSNSVIDFLIELAGKSDQRDSLLKLTSAILALSLHGRPRTTEAYQPVVRTVPARHAIYSLNLVIVAAILGRGVRSGELGIPDWSTQTIFWKSQLSSSDWRTLISSVHVRRSTESTVSITIGSTLPDRVEFTSLHSRVTLREAALDAHFTGDASTNKFKYAFEALPEGRFALEYVRALIELLACPVAPPVRAARYLKWANDFPDLVLDALRRDITVDAITLAKLADTDMGASSAFFVQTLDRVGRGGDDNELLKIMKTLGDRELRGSNYDIAFFDAWLRLYEAGIMPGQTIVEIVNLAAAVDLMQIEAVCPDLLKRLDFVLTEAGITGDDADRTSAPTLGASRDPVRG